MLEMAVDSDERIRFFCQIKLTSDSDRAEFVLPASQL